MSYVQPRAAARPRPWMDREDGECAWPIGEGAMMLSCCAPVMRAPGGLRRTYCRAHWRVMWRPGPPGAPEVKDARVIRAARTVPEAPEPLDVTFGREGGR